MPDEQAVMLIAKATLRGFQEAATLPAVEGKIPTLVKVHGEEDSGMVALLAGNNDQGSIQNKLKSIQFIMIFKPLDKFVENARKRKLGDLTFTLQTPESEGGKVTGWIDTYQFTLPAKKFDAYLKTAGLETDQRIAAGERIWKVEADRFKGFEYRKMK
jgi:hypothetical protein